MNLRLQWLLILVGLHAPLSTGWTAPAVTESVHQPAATQALQQAQLTSAKDWGLTTEEWNRFERIQAGPRRYWSPRLDPLTALGVEATSNQERQRYAELQVRLEAQRAQRELAYQQAYTAAWAKLYPGMLPVQGMSNLDSSSPSVAQRFALFVETQCATCQAQTQRLIAQGLRLDLYLVGSQGDDELIRRWAREAGITPAQINSGQITLNHDRGRWFNLGAHRPLPVRYQQVDGQWQRVE